MKENCYKCYRIAKWSYLPSDSSAYYCDKCVPRGCSCNLTIKPGVEEIYSEEEGIINSIEDYYQPLDELGREYPCCEFLYSETGFDREEDKYEEYYDHEV